MVKGIQVEALQNRDLIDHGRSNIFGIDCIQILRTNIRRNHMVC